MNRHDLLLRIAGKLTPYVGPESAELRAPIVLQVLDQGAFSQADGDDSDAAVIEAFGRIMDDAHSVPESAVFQALAAVRAVYKAYQQEGK